MSHQKDRRRDPRRRTTDVRARMRPGHHLVVIDVSAGGALVEAGRPLRPGSQVEVQMESVDRRGRVAARVVRCTVAAIHPESGVTYQAALSFNESCDWVCESATQDGYPMPAVDAGDASGREAYIPKDLPTDPEAIRRGAK
jgi:hypothetical protein